MRTCPACGKDTEAETTSPCTECGFSPLTDPDGATWEQSSWAGTTETPAEEPVFTPVEGPPPVASSPESVEAPPEAGSTTEPEPASTGYGFPDTPQPPAPAKRTGVGRLVVWVVVAIAIGVANFSSVFDGCDSIGSKPGPTAGETESAIVSDAAIQGLTGATAECPGSAEDTEVDATFQCTVTAPSGASQPITVTNHEDSFEWSRQPFFKLQRNP